MLRMRSFRHVVDYVTVEELKMLMKVRPLRGWDVVEMTMTP